jgi:tetratricopeptide (TPR) repeat protein
MGLGKSIRRILSLGIFFLASISFQCASNLVASAQESAQASSVDTASLDQLEKKFFMQTFKDEGVSHRLIRLEQRVFGKTMSGTDGQRLAHLQEAAGAAPDAIFGEPTPPSTPAPATAGSTNTPASAAANATANTPPPTMPANQPTNTADKENERLRVQEAAEQQINALLSEGVTAWRQHNADLALDRFSQVIRLDPLNSQAYFSLGIIYETQGNYQQALDDYGEANKLQPNNKDYKEAITQARKKLASKQQVDDKQVELSKMSQDALAAYNRGEYLSALDMYKQIDDRFPNQAINKYNIGSVYLIMKQPEMALPYYKKAQELDPKDSRISQAYNTLQQALDQQEQARKTAAASSAASPGYSSPAGPSKHNKRVHTESENDSKQLREAHAAGGYIKNYGLEVKSGGGGLKVKAVTPGTRAAAAGIQSSDVIKAINGTVIDNAADADRILSGCNPMRQLQLTIQRDKRMMQVVL